MAGAAFALLVLVRRGISPAAEPAAGPGGPVPVEMGRIPIGQTYMPDFSGDALTGAGVPTGGQPAPDPYIDNALVSLETNLENVRTQIDTHTQQIVTRTDQLGTQIDSLQQALPPAQPPPP